MPERSAGGFPGYLPTPQPGGSDRFLEKEEGGRPATPLLKNEKRVSHIRPGRIQSVDKSRHNRTPCSLLIFGKGTGPGPIRRGGSRSTPPGGDRKKMKMVGWLRGNSPQKNQCRWVLPRISPGSPPHIFSSTYPSFVFSRPIPFARASSMVIPLFSR